MSRTLLLNRCHFTRSTAVSTQQPDYHATPQHNGYTPRGTAVSSHQFGCRSRIACRVSIQEPGRREKRGKQFEESHHIIQNTFRRLYTCVTWHTWPPKHSDTHLSGTTAPTRWILLLSSGHFLHATHRSSQAGGRHRTTTFFLSSLLPSFYPPTTVRKAEPSSPRAGLEPAATHRHFHGCCIAEQSVATKR